MKQKNFSLQMAFFLQQIFFSVVNQNNNLQQQVQ